MADKDVWADSFSETERERQQEEDREAWNSIVFVLMSIIAVGLMLSFLTIFLVTRYSW